MNVLVNGLFCVFQSDGEGLAVRGLNEAMDSVITECMAALYEIGANGPAEPRLRKVIRLARVAVYKGGCFCTEIEKRFSE